MAICKTLREVFHPEIVPPTPSPFGHPLSSLNWYGLYDGGISSSGKPVRRMHSLPPSCKITEEEREKEFGKFLIWKYRDWY